ncbi:MAG: hypothetical protein WCW67_07530, partial [Candidatus Margulisiibacteriota bacterium]
MKIRFFVLLFIFLTLFHSSGKAIEQQNVLYAKNYLLILVHGVGDDYACLAKIRDHLISNGLDGYVHIYQFSDPFLNIEKEGREFGDRNYKERPEVCVNRPDDKKNDVIDQETKNSDYEKHYWKLTKRPDKTVNSWLEQGKNDFIEWFKDPKRNKNNPSGRAPIDSSGPDNEIPKKYIIIAHSMGG